MISHIDLFEGDPVKNFEKLELIESVAMKPKTRRTTPRIKTMRPAGLFIVCPLEVIGNLGNVTRWYRDLATKCFTLIPFLLVEICWHEGGT
jgi:hypothetical protein